ALADLGLPADPLPDALVLAEVDVVPVADLAQRVLDDQLAEVAPAEARVPGRAEHLDRRRADPHDCRVEGAAAEVIDRVRAYAVIGAEGDRGRRRIVEQAPHVELGQSGRLAQGLALRLPPPGGDGGSPARAGA